MPLPPETATVAVPSHAPEQLSSVLESVMSKGSAGSMVNTAVVSQPLASVMVTLCSPAHKASICGTVCPPGCHTTSNAPVPPTGATSALPSQPPKQVSWVNVRFGDIGGTL